MVCEVSCSVFSGHVCLAQTLQRTGLSVLESLSRQCPGASLRDLLSAATWHLVCSPQKVELASQSPPEREFE